MKLEVLDGWGDCERCPRSRARLAVVASNWPPETKVVVISALASRATQATGRYEPLHLRVVEELRARLGLTEQECVGDVLLACGLGQGSADQVAACAGRFVEHSVGGARPKLVVLVGDQAYRLAIKAGLIENGRWEPVGCTSGAGVVHGTDVEQLVVDAGASLGITPAHVAPEDRVGLPDLAPRFRWLLGPSRGHRFRDVGTNWKTAPTQGLSGAEVRRHFAGERWVSAYALQREQGPRRWRFVVVDVDLHNALQGCHFDNAIAKLRQAFPNSQFVQSSSSGGVHVYVPLPRGIGYEEGALWLRAFVELNDLRFVEASAAGRTLRAQLVEVPRNPPRLPFGVGSHLLGDTRPLADQAQDFMIEIRGAASTDFDRARGSIEEHLGLTGVDARPAARRLDAFLLARETATMVQRNLDPNDPWMAVLDRLPHSSRRRIQRVVAGGVPAYGTRTRWTISLIAAIADHVSPAEAESLMLYWLRDPGRKHVSQEVEFDREPAEEQTVELVRDAYEHIHGVPERFWNDIGSAVRSRYRKAGSTLPFTQDDAIATAFQIARRFYSVGKRTRPVGAWEFGMFCGKNGAHAMQDLLTRGPDWLRWKAPAVQGREGRRFELVQHLWPMRPREPVRFAP